jgi:hypothetical protein
VALAHRLTRLEPAVHAWLATVGIAVRTEPDVWVAYTPGTLLLAPREGWDEDDTLLQIVLHECCHWMVQGELAVGCMDWGLDNRDDRDLGREHAALRLQAGLLGTHGLRGWMMPTTDHRAWYAAHAASPWGPDPAADDVRAAREGLHRWARWAHRSGLEALLAQAAHLRDGLVRDKETL